MQQCAATPTAMHIARNICQLVETATIYTNGNAELKEQVAAAIAKTEHRPERFQVDDKQIKRVGPNKSGRGVVVFFEDGSETPLSFLAHMPKTHINSIFTEQFGLDLAPNGDVKVSAPFQETSVRGVFAAGDCQTPFKTVPNAVASGSMAAAGVSAQLQAD